MIDLKELERRLDKALAKETKDSLNSWLNSQRIDDLEKMDWDPYSREVAPICNSDLGMNLIEDSINVKYPLNLKTYYSAGSFSINQTHSGQRIRYPINYICRYITHTFTKTNDRNMLTQSLVWLFNVNSYSKSDSLGLHPLKSHKKSEWKAYYLVVAEDMVSLEAIVLFVSNFDHQFFRVKSPLII